MPASMKSYLVGGAVRDALLGLPVKDHDWVVVGADPAAMQAAGYLPVGKDFPVFLHPETHEEYALARTERKTAPGYHGFAFQASPDVTLEQDLARRDLTINAMAQDGSGVIVDPHGGRADIEAKVLRHVSPAFAEDPVRILRLARFAARFADFTVAPETLVLMRAMVEAGEVDALVAERVWQEISRGLMEKTPSRMLEVLRDCGALARLAPELDPAAPLRAVLDACASDGAPLAVRYACLCRDLGGDGGTRALSERWKVPTDCRELAELVAREHARVHESTGFDAEARLRLLERCDAWRRPERFEQMLWACECDARGRLEQRDYPQRARLSADLRAALAVDLAAVSAAAIAAGHKGPAIGAAVQQARLEALRARDSERM